MHVARTELKKASGLKKMRHITHITNSAHCCSLCHRHQAWVHRVIPASPRVCTAMALNDGPFHRYLAALHAEYDRVVTENVELRKELQKESCKQYSKIPEAQCLYARYICSI